MSENEAGEGGRSSARLAAVQALYQVALTGQPPLDVIRDFVQGKIGGVALCDDAEAETEFPVSLRPVEVTLFKALVKGVTERMADIDPMIEASLTSSWSVQRLELVVRAILRAGIFELLEMGATPAKVIISEYMDVAVAFYAGPEPKMINAVLDRLAKTLRPHEFS